MTPQMKEILEEFDNWRNDGEHCSIDNSMLNNFDVVMLKEFVQRACVEYVRSVVPSERPHEEEQVWNKYEVKGYNKCIEDIKHNIQQDSLDLPTN